jgi:hypothetical protein
MGCVAGCLRTQARRLPDYMGAVIDSPVGSIPLTRQAQRTLAMGSKLFAHEHHAH